MSGAVASARTPMFGRGAELATLTAELERGTRLLTITGPSGLGKTRLAARVLELNAPAFASWGGAWFCDLSGAITSTDVESCIGRTLGTSLQEGSELGEVLRQLGPTLLVLDNLEHLLPEARATIGAYLDGAPELQILGTSLVPLEIEGESRFELGPLSQEDAVQLYLDRARRAGRHEPFEAEELQAVEKLVAELDRNPLALELAAARVRVLPPSLLLSRVSERFALLRSRRGGRHGSLLGAITFTWELLSAEEQAALARASVFRRGFTLDAAEAILGASLSDVLACLEDLCGKSLLQVEGTRFFLYESVRAFAAGQLEEKGVAEEARRLHEAYFLAAAESWAKRVDGVDAAEAIRWLAAEQENLMAALRNAWEQRPEAAARLGLALAAMLELRGTQKAERELLDQTVEAARRTGDPLLLAAALKARGEAARRHLRLPNAKADLLEALEIARRERALALEGTLLCWLAYTHCDSGAFASAWATLDRADVVVEKAGDSLLRALALFARGSVDCRVGALARGNLLLNEALPIFRSSGDLRKVGRTLLDLGFSYSRLGKLQDAKLAFEEAREIFGALGADVYGAVAMTNLASVYSGLGDLDQAEATTMEALASLRHLGIRRFEGLALGNLGLISLERGAILEANRRLREADAAYRKLGQWKGVRGVFLAFSALTEALLGRAERGEGVLAEADAILEGSSQRELIAVLARALRIATLRFRDGDPEVPGAEEEARAFLAAARKRAPHLKAVESYPLALLMLERVLDAGEDPLPAAGAPAILLGPEAAWFEIPGRGRTDLHRRAALRRILLALAEQRRLAPGAGMDTEELAEAGWPDEKIDPKAASNRVHNAISTLRGLGLSDLVVRGPQGYLLDPELPILEG